MQGQDNICAARFEFYLTNPAEMLSITKKLPSPD